MQILVERTVDDLRKRECVDVRRVHSNTRNYQLPARRHTVVCGIRGLVAELDQRRDRHVVVGVLREPESFLRQLRAEHIDLERRVLADSQIDLRVDDHKSSACLKAEARKLVEYLATVLVLAAEHEALTVVTLLNAGVEIAVAVEREEELLDQHRRLVERELSAVKISLEIGIHIFVKSADCHVVVALEPERKMYYAEELKSLEE